MADDEMNEPKERRIADLSPDQRVMVTAETKTTIGTAVAICGVVLTTGMGLAWFGANAMAQITSGLKENHDALEQNAAENKAAMAVAMKTMSDEFTKQRAEAKRAGDVWAAFFAERNPQVRVPYFSDVMDGQSPRTIHVDRDGKNGP